MQINYEKVVLKKEHLTETITSWYKVSKFNINMCEIAIPMFKTRLAVCVGEYAEYEKMLKYYFNRIEEGESPLACYTWLDDPDTKEKRKFILLTDNNFTAEGYNTLVHETHHFTHLVLGDIGIEYGTAGEELFAYFQGYVVELIIRSLVELKNATAKLKEKKISKKK